MSEHHIDETAHETMDKYEADTDIDTGTSAPELGPAISPAPDPDFAQGGDHVESETATENVPDSAAVVQEVREV